MAERKVGKKFKKPKFNAKRGSKPKQKVKRHVKEDVEIIKLQEDYQNIPKSSDIKTFDDLPLSNSTRKGLKENKFKFPTEIQKQAIGPALLGKDVLGAAITGSGMLKKIY